MKGIKSEKAVYETFPGMSREDAEKKGFVIVENNAEGTAPVYGRYLDTQTGAALETLRDADNREPAPAGGEPDLGFAGASKGSLLNLDDPVVHGTADGNPHEDGAQPNASRNDDLEVEGYVPGEGAEKRKPGRPRKD
jgi:hypothetical protein